jgi:histone H3/H4
MTDTRIEPMDDTQALCFRVFVEMGPERRIPRLAKLDKIRALNVTERMLKRWSTKFRWTEMATKTTNDLAAKVGEILLEDSVTRARKLIRASRLIQDRFIERLAIDPEDVFLDDKQKAKAFVPDYRDFQDAVKLERTILGDPLEGNKDDKLASRLVQELGENELMRAAREIASKRYGLPTSDELLALAERTHEGELA